MEQATSNRPRRASKLALIASLAIGMIGSAVLTAVPAAASGIRVYVAYADNLRANAVNFPTPWDGSPNIAFRGCTPTAAADCAYDGGAIMIGNFTSTTVSVTAITVHIDTCTYTGWAPATLAPGQELIVTQLGNSATSGCTEPTPNSFDTSDIGPGGIPYAVHCTPDGIQPEVDVTINGVTTPYIDSGQVLNTGGVDAGGCPLGSNESTQWTPIGSRPCAGSILTLSPTAQTDVVGASATLTATFTNSCGDPLANVAVGLADQSGPNAGLTRSGTTDANGQTTVNYSSMLTGTDTWLASIHNTVGTITSNPATVTWVWLATGSGAFVIGDKEAHNALVYWWGAQWWKANPMTTGLGPAAFKGYALTILKPGCGGSWSTRPGNSPHPPRTVPAVMAVIVSSHVVKKGPVISGDIAHIVLVRTRPGYGPNPGHPGTGSIVGVVC